jgi:hypothetical protein
VRFLFAVWRLAISGPEDETWRQSKPKRAPKERRRPQRLALDQRRSCSIKSHLRIAMWHDVLPEFDGVFEKPTVRIHYQLSIDQGFVRAINQ